MISARLRLAARALRALAAYGRSGTAADWASR
jgi:hypothetical protein